LLTGTHDDIRARRKSLGAVPSIEYLKQHETSALWNGKLPLMH